LIYKCFKAYENIAQELFIKPTFNIMFAFQSFLTKEKKENCKINNFDLINQLTNLKENISFNKILQEVTLYSTKKVNENKNDHQNLKRKNDIKINDKNTNKNNGKKMMNRNKKEHISPEKNHKDLLSEESSQNGFEDGNLTVANALKKKANEKNKNKKEKLKFV
jgi:hypothetical protein